MKPLATPVLGGMVSSLLHVLIVTPVIFTWLRERQLSRNKIISAQSARSTERQLRVQLRAGNGTLGHSS
jgi:hypothetical protein